MISYIIIKWLYYISGIFKSWAELARFSSKGIFEGFSGKDTVTGESLNAFERTMSFVGAVPLIGNVAKGFVKSEKAIKGISKTAKAAKWADRAYTAKEGYDIVFDDD